jgi:outer membrane protein assembly factor BamB
MNCAGVNRKIELFVLGVLSKSEQIEIKAHLEACPACKMIEEEYRLLVTNIKDSVQPDSLRLVFTRGIRLAIKAEIRSIVLLSVAKRIITLTGSAAACLLFVFIVWHIWLYSGRRVEQDVAENPSEESFHAATLAVSPPSILQAWQYSGVRSVPGSMADGVVVCGQDIYLLQEHEQHTYVAALNIKTGKQKWLSDIESCGYLLADDSRVYCLSPGPTGKFDLVALDATNGKILWKYPQQHSNLLLSPSRPTMLPTGCLCWTANKTVHVLNCASGEPLWTYSIPDGGLLSEAVVVNNNLYVANNTGLYCLSVTTGHESWRLMCGDVVSSRGRALLATAGGEIYASLGIRLGVNRLLCIELKEHNILWSKVVADVTHLYAVGDMLYLRDQDIQALDRKTGQLLWACPATGCNPVTYTEELAYFVDSSDQGRLVALNRYTGCKVWELVGMKSCNAFIKVDRAGFLKTSDGVIHAFIFKG